MYPNLALFLDGEWVSGGGRDTQPVINPANGESLGELPHASDADLERALEAVARTANAWRNVSAYERARILRRAAGLIRERRDAIAFAVTLEEGKTLGESRAEVDAAADIVEWSAEEARRTYGRVIPGRVPEVRQLVIQEPVGPVAAFSPWNFPVTTPSRKISSALAAGCPVIFKAAEETPGSAVELVRAFHDAGVPAGTLNLVFGVPSHISERIIGSPIIRKISFTGSVAVGKLLTRLAADDMKRVTMELGGHSPVLVFADADPVHAARTLAVGKYRNAGQVCIAPTRFYVHESIEKPFTDAFVQATRELRIGNGLDPETTMGPVANSRRVAAMERFVSDARERGAQILTGGRRDGGAGCFFPPTVLRSTPDDSMVMTQEPFGPLAPITPFSDFDDVIRRANSLPFGLASYVFTRSTETALAASAALRCGMVALNSLALGLTETPFGGVRDSGYGQEGGTEGLEAYTTKKFVSLM
ncbi:succinate semialdehyde dehydrogenase [Paraburkholderia sp. BL6665CI2N2]|uniref:NAD-dependent succinate-semialdehyde dehydrogenase n=1 Tax=Paraburkholderia sp. BL6665CI2N2 TaxID=1938806 RepID=UPI0010652C8E|nr:NAD-dependent succinate-semialdehyde dehydrogenase [Paraburkholderia sp. BL6665CI2N2]TDY16863.1 succinate semialdehyde dehydrogenase [Paraburkholderia sp. BL6665CI2N2]